MSKVHPDKETGGDREYTFQPEGGSHANIKRSGTEDSAEQLSICYDILKRK